MRLYGYLLTNIMKYTTDSATKAIEEHLKLATKIASEQVKRLAMDVLKRNPKKTIEFVMAMGTFFFTKPNGEVMYEHEAEELKGHKELDDFVSEYDGTLHITGEPMRFKKDGIITTDW